MIAEKDEEEQSLLTVSVMNSEVSGKIYDGAGNVIDNLGNKYIEDRSGESLTLTWNGKLMTMELFGLKQK